MRACRQTSALATLQSGFPRASLTATMRRTELRSGSWTAPSIFRRGSRCPEFQSGPSHGLHPLPSSARTSWLIWIVFRSAARPVHSVPLEVPTGRARVSSGKYHRWINPSWGVTYTWNSLAQGNQPRRQEYLGRDCPWVYSIGERRQKQVFLQLSSRPPLPFPPIT